ncbi:MAG: OFA family MFS transporter [Actinomycetaceae bacterium]|nr:OFA family MFS transporter [Actinomycetaceae bacterium]
MAQNTKVTNRWLVFTAGVVFNFVLSGTSAFSILSKALGDTGEWNGENIALAYSIYNIMLAIFGIVIGSISSRLNPKLLMYGGSTFFAAGWIVSSLSSSQHVLFYIGFGVIAGIGGGSLYNFTVTNTLKWFPDKRGLISGILLGAATTGPITVAPFTTMLLSHVSAYQVFLILGIIYVALMFLVSWMVNVPPADYKPAGWEPAATGSTNATGEDKNWKQMLATPQFWMLWLIFAFANTPAMMMLSSVTSIGSTQAHFTTAQATAVVMLMAIANFIGRMGFGAISDRIGRYWTLLLALVVDIIAILSLAMINNANLFIVVVMVVGACGGALLVLFPPITAEAFGVKNSGLNYSIMFTAYSSAALIGGQLASNYKESGDYTGAFIIAGVLMGIALVILGVVIASNKKKANA